MKVPLAMLSTIPLEMQMRGQETEGGVFEVEVEIDLQQMRRSGDPFGFFKHELSLHLAQAVLDTGIDKQYWYVTFTDQAQHMFNLPEGGKAG
jgi:hypothetical protein